MESNHSWDLRAPAELLHEIDFREGLTPGATWVVQVDDPPGRQEVLRIDRLSHGRVSDWWPPDHPPDRHEETWRPASDEMRDIVNLWDVPCTEGCPTQLQLIVTSRRGLCEFGPDEFAWLTAQKFMNHFQLLFTGGIILVTEHGWAEFMTKRGALDPAAAA